MINKVSIAICGATTAHRVFKQDSLIVNFTSVSLEHKNIANIFVFNTTQPKIDICCK